MDRRALPDRSRHVGAAIARADGCGDPAVVRAAGAGRHVSQPAGVLHVFRPDVQAHSRAGVAALVRVSREAVPGGGQRCDGPDCGRAAVQLDQDRAAGAVCAVCGGALEIARRLEHFQPPRAARLRLRAMDQPHEIGSFRRRRLAASCGRWEIEYGPLQGRHPMATDRWRIPVGAVAVHVCIGSVYSWSTFNRPIQQLFPTDPWWFSPPYTTFTTALVLLGLSAAFMGPWVERRGPRVTATWSALFFGSGLLIGGLGLALRQSVIVFLGMGIVGGIGCGLGYISPVSTLVKWFPDRRGMATGMAIMGFGGGAFV